MSCILIVEDDKMLRLMLLEMLEAEGYAVMAAPDGLEALNLMEQRRPDLILADIMMPRMDGFAFYRAVQGHLDWVPIPFIFLTAKSDQEDVLAGKALGVEDYLTKPFTEEELFVALEARLKRAQAIREASSVELNRLKQQIINVLGHELRTPLTYIAGYTSLAMDDAPNLTHDQFREFLDGIKLGSDRLQRMVKDFMLVFDLDSGTVEANFETMADYYPNLGALIAHTVMHYEPEAMEQSVVLDLEVPQDLPSVRLYEEYFVNALGRLVSNAIKFCRYRGEGSKVVVSAKATEGWVEIAVADNGIGIAPDQVDELFERFRQLNRERMEQQGLGLGLYIAHKIIRMHKGDILIESELDIGSTFTIRLPC